MTASAYSYGDVCTLRFSANKKGKRFPRGAHHHHKIKRHIIIIVYACVCGCRVHFYWCATPKNLAIRRGTLLFFSFIPSTNLTTIITIIIMTGGKNV